MPKITSVSYSKLYPLAIFSNERIGVEMSVGEGEDAKSALETCKALVHEFHFEANKELYAMLGTKVVPVGDDELPVVQHPRLTQEQSIINDISTVTDLKVLESYKLIAKSNLEIQKAYDNQLKNIQNGNTLIIFYLPLC